MTRQEFLHAAESVMRLVSADDEAQQLYGRKLLADAAQPLEGAMSRTTRRAVEAMATAWLAGVGPALAAQRFVEALSHEPNGLSALAASPAALSLRPRR